MRRKPSQWWSMSHLSHRTSIQLIACTLLWDAKALLSMAWRLSHEILTRTGWTSRVSESLHSRLLAVAHVSEQYALLQEFALENGISNKIWSKASSTEWHICLQDKMSVLVLVSNQRQAATHYICKENNKGSPGHSRAGIIYHWIEIETTNFSYCWSV